MLRIFLLGCLVFGYSVGIQAAPYEPISRSDASLCLDNCIPSTNVCPRQFPPCKRTSRDILWKTVKNINGYQASLKNSGDVFKCQMPYKTSDAQHIPTICGNWQLYNQVYFCIIPDPRKR